MLLRTDTGDPLCWIILQKVSNRPSRFSVQRPKVTFVFVESFIPSCKLLWVKYLKGDSFTFCIWYFEGFASAKIVSSWEKRVWLLSRDAQCDSRSRVPFAFLNQTLTRLEKCAIKRPFGGVSVWSIKNEPPPPPMEAGVWILNTSPSALRV